MGLFDGGAKRELAEKAITQALSRLPILDDLVSTVVNNEEAWVSKCQGYYDSRLRTITIGADLFQIKWTENGSKGNNLEEKVLKEVNYAYTASGYTPLHNHVNEKGREDISVGRVIYLWGKVIKDRLQAEMPGCRFEDVYQFEDRSSFTYTVPKLVWKRWF